MNKTPTGRLSQRAPEPQFIRPGSFRLITPKPEGVKLQEMDLTNLEVRVICHYQERNRA